MAKENNDELNKQQAEWQAPQQPEQNIASQDFQQNPSEQLVAQSSFEEWCRLNGSINPDLYSKGHLTASEKISNYDAVFREGSRRLMAELRDPKDNGVKLIDKLNLPGLKSELDALRAQGDVFALGKREEEIAHSFQQAISEYTYKGSTCHVVEILDKKEMNCVGASVLGGRLLDEVGIKYLVANIGSHVLLIVVTGDARVLWQDMQDGKERKELENEELTAEKIEGKNEGGENITPMDIVSFANNPKNDGMTFFVKKEYWKNKPMKVLPSELGLELNELINTGFMLGNGGKNKEAVEVLQLAAQKAPNNSDVYLGLARAYKNLGLYNEAIGACNKALEIEPTDSYLKGVVDELKGLAGITES